jgi:PKD domain
MPSRARLTTLRVGICALMSLTGVALTPGSVQASPLAVVSFTVTPAHVDDGQTSVFNVTVSGGTGPYGYNWSGLPPSQSWAPCIAANVSKLSCSAGVPGAFWIGVNVTDSAGQSAAGGPVELTVAEPIGFESRATPHQGTVPLTVAFTNYGFGGTPPYTFSWIFGDGSEAKVANTSHTYAAAGTYYAYGCMGDSLRAPLCDVTLIRVLALLTVTLTAEPAMMTVLERTFLNATASGGLPNWTYAWSSLPPGCLSQNVSSLSCVPTAPGTYTVQETVTDSFGHTTSATVTIQVAPLAGPQPLPSGMTTLIWVTLAAVIAVGLGLVALAFVVWRMRRPPGRS